MGSNSDKSACVSSIILRKNYPCTSYFRMTNRPILYLTNLTVRVESGYFGSKTVNFFVVSAVIPSLLSASNILVGCSKKKMFYFDVLMEYLGSRQWIGHDQIDEICYHSNRLDETILLQSRLRGLDHVGGSYHRFSWKIRLF